MEEKTYTQKAGPQEISYTTAYYKRVYSILASYGLTPDINCEVAENLIARGMSKKEFYCIRCKKILKNKYKAVEKKRICEDCEALLSLKRKQAD